MKDVKEITVRRGRDKKMHYHFDGKSIGIANAAALIEGYCKAGADYELRVNAEVFEDKGAQALKSLTANELAKVEWYKGMGGTQDYMKPIDGENGAELVRDEKKIAEETARCQIHAAIYDLMRCEDFKKEQALYEQLAELAKEYPQVYLKKLEQQKATPKKYADWSEHTGRPNVLKKLEEIAKNIPFDEDDGSNDDAEEDFLTNCDAEIEGVDIEDELVDPPVVENQVTFPVMADQFTALELADDYFPNLNISGKLTKSNGVLTAINNGGIQVRIYDEHLEITGENVNWRIDYDIAESTFCAALREVTMKAITEGKVQDTFEIVGKSGLIYTYTESTLKPVLAETQEQYNARVNSTPKEIATLDTESANKVDKLWKILRQKQKELKAIMTEENIVATRKYSVKIAEIKLIVEAINNLTKPVTA